MSTSGDRPRVSVAIPAYNAEPWIADAVQSALDQSVTQIEVVVVDDASSDGTAAAVAALGDPRVRLLRNATNLGHSRNWNHVVSLCRAPYVKFLCGDDLLRADCVEKMLALFERSDEVGLVFSRRAIEFSEADVAGREFRDAYESRHLSFGPLADVNSGRRLFEKYLETSFDDNWIGEPTNVMMRRELLERLPGFHPFIQQAADMELWVRAIFHSDVGFVDEPLATYRAVTEGSLTEQNFRDDRLWLDRLWFLESLLADDEIRRSYPELARMARKERLRCALRFARGIRRPAALSERFREARAYVAYKNSRRRRGVTLESSPAAERAVR